MFSLSSNQGSGTTVLNTCSYLGTARTERLNGVQRLSSRNMHLKLHFFGYCPLISPAFPLFFSKSCCTSYTGLDFLDFFFVYNMAVFEHWGYCSSYYNTLQCSPECLYSFARESGGDPGSNIKALLQHGTSSARPSVDLCACIAQGSTLGLDQKISGCTVEMRENLGGQKKYLILPRKMMQSSIFQP